MEQKFIIGKGDSELERQVARLLESGWLIKTVVPIHVAGGNPSYSENGKLAIVLERVSNS